MIGPPIASALHELNGWLLEMHKNSDTFHQVMLAMILGAIGGVEAALLTLGVATGTGAMRPKFPATAAALPAGKVSVPSMITFEPSSGHQVY